MQLRSLLAYLRELQRRHALAVLLVHHARKSAGNVRAGQALRGSSEFHAWGDSNLYLRRATGGQLTLTVEHRAAASLPSIALELTERDAALALSVLEKPEACAPAPVSIDARITAALAAAARPVPLGELRHFCRVRHATLHERLRALTGAGHLLHDGAGYRLAANSAVTSPSSR